MMVVKHFFRDPLSLLSFSDVLTYVVAYPTVSCNKGCIMKLEINEEILVVYFIGKAKGPERFLVWCND